MNDEEETEEDEMDEDEYVDNGDEDDEEEEEYEEDDEEEDGVAGQPNGIKSALNGYSKDVAGYARGWLSHDFELSGMLISWVWMSQAIRRRPPQSSSRLLAHSKLCIPFVAPQIE